MWIRCRVPSVPPAWSREGAHLARCAGKGFAVQAQLWGLGWSRCLCGGDTQNIPKFCLKIAQISPLPPVMAKMPTNGISGKGFHCGTGRISEKSCFVLCALLWFNHVVRMKPPNVAFGICREPLRGKWEFLSSAAWGSSGILDNGNVLGTKKRNLGITVQHKSVFSVNLCPVTFTDPFRLALNLAFSSGFT